MRLCILASLFMVLAPMTAAAADKSVWAEGLRDPHGMALEADGNVLIAEYKGGTVSRFSPDGKKLGAVAEGLKSPAWVATAGNVIYITERKANRVVKIADGKAEPLPHSVDEPLGLVVEQKTGRLVVLSHTTSRLFSLSEKGQFQAIYTPAGAGDHYGFRCVTVGPEGDLLVTDETDGRVLRIPAAGGTAQAWVTGLEDPSGIAVGPNGAVYVADEGAGTVVRLSSDGKPTVVAEDLGEPRGLLFLPDGSLLVGDRDSGNVYRLTLK